MPCHDAGQGRGKACYWPRRWHGMLLAKAVAWHAAGQGLGIMLLVEALAWRASGRGCGMACCWPRLWHGMLLAEAVA